MLLAALVDPGRAARRSGAGSVVAARTTSLVLIGAPESVDGSTTLEPSVRFCAYGLNMDLTNPRRHPAWEDPVASVAWV